MARTSAIIRPGNCLSHRKTASLKSDKPVNVIEPTRYEITSAISAQEYLTEKDAITETRSLSSEESLPSIASENKQIATTVLDTFDDTTQTPTSTENQVAIFSHEVLDTAILKWQLASKT
jgi:hypothetical protein